jgi:outer membrane protein OmpA-like peptidoglycan-associated protein
LGHKDSNIELEVTAYVTGHGQPMEGGGPNLFVPYPVPRPYPKLESAHDVKLTPRGLKEGGEIRFVTKAKYKLYEDFKPISTLPSIPKEKYSGTVQYTHTFKYHFEDSGDSKIDGEDLIIDEPVAITDEKSPGQHAIKLNFRFDKRDGSNRGPKFIRVMPSFEYLTISPSSGDSHSWTGGTQIKPPDWLKRHSPIPLPEGEGSYTRGSDSGETTNYPTPEDTFGALTLNLIVPRIEVRVPKSVPLPPLATLTRLSFLTVGFAKEKQANVDSKIAAAITAWKTELEQYHPAIDLALRDGAISVYFDGYASKTGSDILNDRLANDRATNVKNYIKMKLGVPEAKTSVKSYGEEKAEWKVEVDRKLREVFKPRDQDRAVVIWMKYEELERALRGGK